LSNGASTRGSPLSIASGAQPITGAPVLRLSGAAAGEWSRWCGCSRSQRLLRRRLPRRARRGVRIVRPRIDHRKLARRPDQVGLRPGIGEGRGVGASTRRTKGSSVSSRRSARLRSNAMRRIWARGDRIEMTERLILVLDEGPRPPARCCSRRTERARPRQREITQHYHGRAGSSTIPPRSGTRRCNARANWSNSGRADRIACIGITNQRETVVAWTGRVASPWHARRCGRTGAPRAPAPPARGGP